MSFDENRYYREVDVMRDGYRDTVRLQKTGIGADIHVYLKGQDIGSIEPFRLEVLVSLPGEQHPRTGMQRTAVRPTEQDALNLLLDVHEQERAHADGCHISRHHHREVREGVVTPVLNPRHGGGPKTYLLTQSMGIITGLAPAEQDFIDRQPNGTKVGLVREMFAFDPDRLDVDPGREPTAPPAPTNVSDNLVSFVEYLATEVPAHYARVSEHAPLWWEHPRLVAMFDNLMTRWASNDIPDPAALHEAFGTAVAILPVDLGGITPDELGAAIEAHFADDPEIPEPTGVSDHLASFVEFLSRETPVQWERATEHSALWWEHPELMGIFQDLLDRWESNDIADDTALMYAFSEALDARFGDGPEPDAQTTDPSTND